MLRRTLFLCCTAFLFSRFAFAAPAASPARIEGTVLAEGEPVAGASVRLAGTSFHTVSDAEGKFAFDALPARRYVVEVESARAGRGVATVDVAAGATATVEVAVDLMMHGEEITVTASPEARSTEEITQAVKVLEGIELLEATRATLGETVAQQVGVNQTFFGPGASRPVIRGIGGDRIRILQSGLGTGDASTTSPDHAVTTNPGSAGQIEIVRGPATLLYGSSAIGGVVNVIGEEIPRTVQESPISGAVTLTAGSNSDTLSGAASLTGGAGSFAWHADGFKSESDDYESGDGVVPNSYVNKDGGTVGGSFVSESGFAGASYGVFNTEYGNPGEAEAGVFIDMKQKRWDLAAGTDRELGILRAIRFRAGGTDYEHVEVEGGAVGTQFLNDSREARVELTHRAFGPFAGTFGAQYVKRDFSAIGEEAFVPETATQGFAAFLFEEIGTGELRGQLGLRYDSQDNDAKAFPAEEGEEPEAAPPSRSFSSTSASAGLVWNPGEIFGLGLSLSRSIKFPNAEELYSNGPHIATGAFEIGDPTLDQEKGIGGEVSLRARQGRVHGELNVFYNRFDGYIFESFTDELVGDEEPLRVVRIVQSDAEFQGAELDAHVELLHLHPHHLELDLTWDTVRAEERGSGDPLPRIPPMRYGAGIHYQGEQLSASLFGRHVENQDRISEFETATDGYDTIDASVGYRFFLGGLVHDLVLTGTNLTDELAFNHISFLKEAAPLPGRDFRLSYRLTF